MSIVRSLLISIGFKTDKKAINETNKAIIGFKTRFALVATASVYAFKVVKDFFSGIASAALDTDELARGLGLTLKQITAIQQGFQKFRISDTQALVVLKTVQKDLNDFLQGAGRLPQVLQQLQIFDEPRNLSVLELFNKIVLKIRDIGNEQERIRIASKYFGDTLGAKVSDLSQDFDGFTESINKAYAALKDTPDVTPEYREYEQSVNDISNSLYMLWQTIVKLIAPAIKEFAGLLNSVIKAWTNFFNGNIESSLQNFKDAFSSVFGFLNSLSSAIGNPIKGFIDYFEPYVTYDPNAPKKDTFQGYGDPLAGILPASWISYVENRVDLNMPEGTTGEQAQFLGGQIQEMIRTSINATFNEIQYNNPVVE